MSFTPKVMVVFFVAIFLSINTISVLGTNDLLASRNGDMEDNSVSYWATGNGCNLDISTTQVYGGSQSVYVHNRTSTWAGIAQTLVATSVNLTVDKMYAFVGFIRLENLPNASSYVEVQVMMLQRFNDGTQYYSPVSFHPYTKNGTWIEVGGDFKLPDNLKNIFLYIQVMSAEVNYHFDSASLVELVPDPNWMTTAEANIDLYRKVKLDLVLQHPSDLDLTNYTVELVQTKSQFGHGTAVQASAWNDQSSSYRDFVLNTMKAEWVVLENDMKWTIMEPVEGSIVFNETDTALTDFKNNGINVRGHTMFWGSQTYNPSWIQTITNSTVMLAKLDTRITGTMKLVDGRVAHWDVNNENLHHKFLKDTSNDGDLTGKLFRDMYRADPTPSLFLNDYEVVNAPRYTTAMKEEAMDFVRRSVPIGGIGAQGHFQSASAVDVTRIKYRLDKIAEAGLPIWITEFSITEADTTVKTAALEEALTMFFSHEKVEGVLLWGFWTGAIYDSNNALATGASNSITWNTAGNKYIELVNTKWRTNWIKPLTSLSQELCFKGDYTVHVKQNGVTRGSHNISLTQNSTVVVYADTGTICISSEEEECRPSYNISSCVFPQKLTIFFILSLIATSM